MEGMEAGWSTGAMDIGDEDVDGPRVEGQRGGRGWLEEEERQEIGKHDDPGHDPVQQPKSNAREKEEFI